MSLSAEHRRSRVPVTAQSGLAPLDRWTSCTQIEQWSANLDLQAIERHYHGPTYVFNPHQLRRNFAAYLQLVAHPARVAFPVKANPSMAVLRELSRLGGSVDCAALTEVQAAELAGFTLERILYNTPAPETGVAINLARRGATVIADAVELLFALDAAHRSQPLRGRVFLRINPGVRVDYDSSADWQTLTAHAERSAKFGVAAEEVIDLLQRVRLPVCGLHAHVGTQMDNLAAFRTLINLMHELRRSIGSSTQHRIEWIDLGGGLGIAFVDGERYPTLDEFTAALRPLRCPDLGYIVEPGHSLVGNTMGLVTRVVTVKTVRGKRWAIVDAGTDQLAKTTLLKWPHRVLGADLKPLPMEGPDALGGPLCFSGDTLLSQTAVSGVREGDLLFVQHCGAYCYSLSNQFNGRRYGGMLRLDDSGGLRRCHLGDGRSTSPSIGSYDWSSEISTSNAVAPVSAAQVERLSSTYLRQLNCDDNYSIASAERLGHDTYRFVFQVSAAVPFVSMPFAIRLTGDAAIIAVLHRSEKDSKDVDVWSDELVIHSNAQISPDSPISCLVSLSALGSRRSPTNKVAIARFSLDDGGFCGYFRLKFTLRH